MNTSPRRLASLLALAALALPAGVRAQIVTDGTLGRTAQTLSGPNYTIPETLGRLVGSNLFHSFQTFNIRGGESALFHTTTPTIANVISRVTGGTPTTINGPLLFVAADGRPGFYFINPAGVIFGAGATIDVPGAFHVGTADHVSFPDGRFHADPAKASTFSSAAPEAFGFVGERRAPISLSGGADLMAYPDQDVSLVAGDIGIDAGRVKSDGGRLRLTALGQQAAEVPFAGALPAGRGTLSIVRNGLLSVTDSCCALTGTIQVSAGTVLIDGNGVPANNTGIFGSTLNSGSSAATIDIAAQDSFTLRNGGTVTARSWSSGAGGTVGIRSPLVTIDNAMIDVVSLSSGHAGTVAIEAQRIALQNGGQIWASAQSTGDGGEVRLTARESIEIGRRNAANSISAIVIQTLSDAAGGHAILDAPRIRLYDDGMVWGYADWTGRAGWIDVKARDLILENGGVLYTFGLYTPGGRVTVDASNSVVIRGKNEAPNPSPGADMVSTGILGHATYVLVRAPQITISESGAIRAENWYQNSPGYVSILTDGLTLLSGGHISGNALGHSGTEGRGGTIVIRANEFVKVEGSSNGRDSTIASGTRSGNDAGRIDIATPWLRVADRGVINTSTGRFGESGAGRIDIAVDRLELVDLGRLASIEFGHTASGGHIAVNARESILLDGGKIIAQGANEAAAGRLLLVAPLITLRNGLITTSNAEYATSGGIDISADRLVLSEASRIESSSTSAFGAGDIALHVRDLASIADSAVTTTSYSGSGGNVRVDGGNATTPGNALALRNSLITTSVLGLSGDGGDIAINTRALAMDNAFIQANTVATNFSGGNIDIDVASLLPSGNILFVGGQTPYDFRSVPGFNVIQAAAPTGINGAINISTPALDISGSLVGLSAQTIEIGNLGRSPCQPTGGSSLVQVGRGGFPPAARKLLGIEPAGAQPPLPPPASHGPRAAARQLLAQQDCGKQ